jgi:hypothetical protein
LFGGYCFCAASEIGSLQRSSLRSSRSGSGGIERVLPENFLVLLVACACLSKSFESLRGSLFSSGRFACDEGIRLLFFPDAKFLLEKRTLIFPLRPRPLEGRARFDASLLVCSCVVRRPANGEDPSHTHHNLKGNHILF